jgi:DNA helicase-2/ATP-dependent DNA helicase PcrA
MDIITKNRQFVKGVKGNWGQKPRNFAGRSRRPPFQVHYISMDLSVLNLQQLEAVLHKDGPLLVFAGAGSGKTRVITYRIANLIHTHGVSPRHILAVTFTNKAANEMKERLRHLLGDAARGLWVGTFHSICLRILRESGTAIGIPPNFVVYDESDQLEVVRQALIALNIDEKQFNARTIANQISRAKERLLTPEQYQERAIDFFERIVASVYRNYQAFLRSANALDFDDLLVRTIELLETQPLIRARYQDQFRYILVDEYQDVNYAQYVLVRLLAENHRNLCVVGDDDQAIYSFRGAEVELILRFEQDFPDAKVVKLERNYRSTQPILDAAHKVIQENTLRAPKKLWTERTDGAPITFTQAIDQEDEARIVADYIFQQVRQGKRRFKDFAVLYRTNAQSRAFEERFLRERIPYRLVGALRFYDRREIKDLLAYLRVVVNPDDSVSLKRIINVPPRQIGQSTLNAVQAHAAEWGISLYQALNDPRLLGTFTPKTLQAVQQFVLLIEELREFARTHSLTATVKRLLESSGYLAWLEQKGDADSLDRAGNLREFVTVVEGFERKLQDEEETPEDTLNAFLQHIALLSDIDTLDESRDQVVMMTFHAAKGLEFPVVFLVGLEQGIIPHALSETPRDIEEERRLLYVGMTRAMDELHLLCARERSVYGSRKAAIPSPFLRALADTPMPSLFQLRYGGAKPSPLQWTPPHRRQEPPKPAPEKPAPFLPGQRVHHPQHGYGIVVRTQEHVVTVMFPGGKGLMSFPLQGCPLEEA